MKPADWTERTFSQKVAWRCRHPDPQIDYRVWADKHQVKDLVRPGFNVAETWFVTGDPRSIDAARLPPTFVMKATHGWDMSVLVVDGVVQAENRSIAYAGVRADTKFLQAVARTWLRSEHEVARRAIERQYGFVEPGILFEQYLAPIDYELQLFLFNGRCRLTMVLYRGFYHQGTKHRLYDEQWQRLEPGSADAESRYERAAPETPRPPADFLEKLEGLCRPIDHVRADFYVCGDRYYFSEFTFTHNRGAPGLIGRYDAALGRYWLG